jgi:hypothetical protein
VVWFRPKTKDLWDQIDDMYKSVILGYTKLIQWTLQLSLFLPTELVLGVSIGPSSWNVRLELGCPP